MGRPDGLANVPTPASAPRYELRVRAHAAGDSEYTIWQLPSPATPHVRAPARIAGLRGRNLELIEHRVLRRLARFDVRPRSSPNYKKRGYSPRRRLRSHAGAAVQSARAHAPPREHACRCRGHRDDGARGGRVLARYGDASPTTTAGTDCATGTVDRDTNAMMGLPSVASSATTTSKATRPPEWWPQNSKCHV